MQLDGGELFELARFRVLPRQRQLLGDGASIELGSCAFDVLTVLIESGTISLSRSAARSRMAKDGGRQRGQPDDGTRSGISMFRRYMDT